MRTFTCLTINHPTRNITANGPGEAISAYAEMEGLTLVGNKRFVESPILHWEWDRSNGMMVWAIEVS